MSDVIIPDTSLCAIVRDEIVNPAGGIIKFIDFHLPHVEAAVIVDTGSIDGTRELLEELKGKYPHLEVHDKKFKGYAPSRNYSLKKVRTKKVLVLDADERLTKKDFSKLYNFIIKNPSKGYRFDFLDVYPNREQQGGGHNPRLFELMPSIKYKDKWEWLYLGDELASRISGLHTDTRIQIKHFRPSEEIMQKKTADWYTYVNGVSNYANKWHEIIGKKIVDSPSKCPSFLEWKAHNPREIEFI